MKTFQPPGGESFADLALRVLPAFDEAITNTSGDLLIVAHAGVNRTILATLLNYDLNDVHQIPQDYATGHLTEMNRVKKCSESPPYPIVAKLGGIQVQGVHNEAAVL